MGVALHVQILIISDLHSHRERVPANLANKATVRVGAAAGGLLTVAKALALEHGGHQGGVVDVSEPACVKKEIRCHLAFILYQRYQ